MIYRCTKTITLTPYLFPSYVAFTEGKLYEGKTAATPGGDSAIMFKNDADQDHLITYDWLRNFFEKIEEENHVNK